MCDFPFYSGNSVGSLSGVGYGVFVLTGVESTGEVAPFFVFIPIVFESKGGGLIELFWRPTY